MKPDSKDLCFLSRALELARRGEGLVSPGAMVGAVVTSKDRIIGEGYYRYEQMKHAEVIAIAKAGHRAHGATLYLNLEPCSHFGRTPPCADLVVHSGIRRVVCSMRDPNPLVSGLGFRKLRGASIEVVVGGLEAEARGLNEAFVHFIITRRPFVTLKSAMTLDARIAPAHQKRGSVTWITSEASRRRAQQIRHAQDALLVGINTILQDDPLLTDRSGRPRRRKLLRVVLDSRLRIPMNSRMVRTADQDVLVFCSLEASSRKRQALERAGIQIVPVRRSRKSFARSSFPLDWNLLLKELAARDIQSLLIEGGGETNWSALQAGIINKFCFFVAPRILGGHHSIPVFGGNGFSSMPEAAGLRNTCMEQIGEEMLITGYPRT